MGYAFLVAAPERALLLECGIVDVRASTTAAERLLAISEALDDLIRQIRVMGPGTQYYVPRTRA